jgi:hypothetical protein
LFCILSQTKLISWNIANFGQSKSDKTIHYTNYLRDYDIIAVQVVAGYGGVVVARLADELNHWLNGITISDPTVAT